ncbi:MAG TPA: ATP-binding protein [Solirubrobacteraceae bacterium]|jgi:anti-sigma regulatory factor (Ser/Thr protein kinase)
MFYSEQLTRAPQSPAAARRIVERLGDSVDEETLGTLRLLVSELVTNAVEHVDGDAEIELDVELRGDTVRVEVRDGGPGFAYRGRQAGDPQGSGWGLHFVDRLAERWSADSGDGSRVWFEMPARAAAPRA